MTATTNGASLEDCLTNIFSLIDLNGIRWKRFKAKENSSYLYTPIYTHPILTTYAKCIEENHIAVWRHEPQKRHTAGGGAGHPSGQPGSTGHSNFPTPTRASNNNTPTSAGPSNNGNQGNNNTSNSGQTNYELWIFGYGNQLRVDNVIGDDLVEIEDDTWESKGLSYECRTLLFKALHNLVERCLIGKGFTRIGRWFVQPLAETALDAHYNSSSSFASSSLKNKHLKLDQSSINSALISSLNRIIESDGLRHTSTRSSNTYFTSSLDGSKSSLSFAFSFFVHGDSTICATVDVRQHPLVHPLTMADLTTYQEGGIVRVALAPYGLNGILNGVSYKDSDNGSATTTFIQQWSKFYPLPKTMARLVIDKQSTNSAMTNFNQKIPSNASNQFNQSIDGQSINGSRSYLSNLTNMLLPPSSQKSTIHFNHEPNEVPPVVEVIVSGYRMRYPAECVFTTSKVVDIYKSLSVSSNSKSATASNKRPNRSSSNKSHKISILNEKLSEEKTNSQVKIKTESDISATAQSEFNSPFKVSSTETTSMTKPDRTAKQSVGSDMTKDKTVNGYAELEGNNPALINNQTTLSRFNSTKVGFGSNNTPLGPTDLVKLFPTPPSLEQIILSPSNQNEEASAKDITTLSPSNMNQTADITRDNGIDVYKPVECALMPPPPKWAALANIVISSSKSLPPECVYKGSPQNSKSIISRFTESIKSSLPKCSTTKQIASLIHKNSIHSPAPSPLTDQTNKNGPNSLNLNSSPQKTLVISSLTTTSTSNSSLPTTDSSITPILSSFTLPHQRLFNNLNEVNSIQLNLMISDSTLGMFKDHNFESCTICVCNMSIKGIHLDAIPHKIEQNVQWKSTIGNDNMVNCPPFPGEFINECTCGFSAINNRHSSHLSGLFLEDELELTNVLYDPTEMIDQNKLYRKIRLSSYSESSYAEEEKLVAQKLEKISSQSSHSFEETKIFVIDQLKQQCTSIIHSNSSLSKVILIESFRNNRHLTSCTNYYAQTTNKSSSNGPFYRFLDDSNKHITVKMMNRNPLSLKFSDFCELTKGIITKLGGQSQAQSRFSGCLVKPLGTNSGASSGLSSIFSRMFSPNRQSLFGKSNDSHSNARNNIFIQGLQALVMPTLSIDPKEALQMLEYLIKDESKEALATLNKAILIFTSPIHDWQFLTAPVPENNFDVANLLKIIQPLLDESIGTHNKLYKDFVHQQQQHIFSARDSPTGAPVLPTPPCQGPLTWRQFHQSAGRGTEDQCEPQPIPSLLVGHAVEKNHLAVSPFALKFWDKLLLEPYASAHNMYYLVLAPDSKNVIGHITTFFKELSNTYELMKLGKHQPIGNGIIKSASNSEIQTDEDDWFSKLSYGEKDPANAIASKLKSYASKLNATLAKTIVDFLDERQPAHDPHADRFDSSPSPHGNKPLGQVIVKTSLPQTSNRAQNHILGMGSSNCQLLENFGGYGSENQSQLESQAKSQTLISSSSHAQEDNIHLEDESSKQTGIVIYIVDPFSSPSITQNLRALATFGLLKCYSILLAHLPEHVKRVTQLQLISLDSIISHSRSILNISMVDQLKSLSMNVYSRCRKILTNQITAKSLTGFGPAAALESFFKTKNAELCLTKMFTPPFILAPMKDKQTELGEMFGDRREKSSVLFCSYCITEDQRWLLASITNDKGEMSESTVININIVDRLKKPKSTVKRVALRKLMEFIISVMSDWMNPWRLIIGKLGRVGHGELKEWATLMSKRSLLNYSRHLTERCRQCSILPSTETVSVLSACLVSMEPDSRLRIMPDQFTSDDRQASFNKCPLSTPEDASATHILVFPTSASIQSAHGNVEDPLNGSGLDDDLLNQFPLEDGIEDLGVEENMDDLFSAWDDTAGNVADNISSHHDTMMSSSNLQLGTGSVGDGANSQDETLQLLQQPLALGYYISTAKIGHMPNWFWSTSPHLRNSCPVFLKSALHIHMPCVQLSDDLLHSGVGQSRKSHQLDSNLTTDVLRYVLEGYNSLSWLALNPKSYDRQSCLPVHMQNLLQLYHMMESFS